MHMRKHPKKTESLIGFEVGQGQGKEGKMVHGLNDAKRMKKSACSCAESEGDADANDGYCCSTRKSNDVRIC